MDSDSNLQKLIQVLNGVADIYRKRIIFSAHPRTRRRLEECGAQFNPLVELMKPLGFFDYVCLQKNAFAVLSDSGTITEESSILNFPAVNIREAHERPEGMEEGAVMMTGLEMDRILQALEVLQDQPRGADRRTRMVQDYDAPAVSEKVIRIIVSYTDYVNRLVWRKF